MYGHFVLHLNLSRSAAVSQAVGYFRGVPIFFVLSGLLIWHSIERTPTYTKYLKKRVLRVYPELWGAVIVEIMSIIVFFNDWNCRDLMLFSFTQGTVLQFWTPDSLRGYGCGTPNGALWTMCVTIQFYIVVWFMHKIMHKKELYIWGVAFAILITSSIAGQIIIKKTGSEILVKLYGQTIVRYGWLFFIGCFVAEFKRKIIPILSKYWLVSIFDCWSSILYYKIRYICRILCYLVNFAYIWNDVNVPAEELKLGSPTIVFATGLSRMLGSFTNEAVQGIIYQMLVLAVSVFCLTSLDTATRLARYMFQEFWLNEGETPKDATGVRGVLANPYISTAITVVLGVALGLTGYSKIWPLFGAANQLLAALGLLAVCAWLGSIGRNNKMFYIPMVFMLIVTLTSLVQTIMAKLKAGDMWSMIQAGLAVVLVVLAIDLAVTAFRTLSKQ